MDGDQLITTSHGPLKATIAELKPAGMPTGNFSAFMLTPLPALLVRMLFAAAALQRHAAAAASFDEA
jgi:hypothetical protein